MKQRRLFYKYVIPIIGIVVVALLGVSVILSRQRRQIDRLIEDTAILTAEVRAARGQQGSAARSPSDPPADSVDRAAHDRGHPHGQ